ncbi:hypothetical protein E9232_005200 [Inquilinus ginsengisoli]|uniref:DUF2125 domain-containing protein n=1 Tax=Inquilinus ginsengisoli TaxID=363840 RepID=A0ABU1JVK3_9PROT|nr:hypothetical protein [Inquilinus ginsengisoli]MDR6292660.1 hypothetical protein [Inquilinus ginsengisoli]
MRRLASTLLGSALLGTVPLWLSAAAFAQATPEGAAALQKGLTTILTPALAAPGAGTPIFEGGWTVEPAGAEYRITGPALALALRDDADGQKRVLRIRCDGDRYTATPTEAAVYRLHGETPFRCEIQPGGGEPAAVVTSRARRADLTLDLAASLLTASADQSDGVTITADGKVQVTVDRLRLTSATTPRAGSPRQDVALQVEARGISAGDPTTGDAARLAHARYSTRLEDVDAVALRERVWRLVAFALDAAQRDPKAPAPPNFERKADVLLRQVMALAGRASQTEMVLTDMRSTSRDTVAGFESLTVSGGYHGLDPAAPGPGLGGAVAMELKGLKVGAAAGARTGDQPDVTIGRLRLAGALDPAAGGAGTGSKGASLTYGVDLDGLAVKAPDDDVDVSLANGHYGGRLDGVDVAAIIDAVQTLQGLAARHPTGEPSPQEIDGLVAKAQAITAALSGYQVDLGLDGLRVAAPDVKVALGRIGFGESYQGLDRDDGTGRVTAELKGLAIDPPPPLADWIPRDGEIALSLKSVPFRSIAAALWSGVTDTIESPGGGEEAEMAFAKAMGGVLRNSSASLDVDAFHIAAPQGAIRLGGSVRADRAATYGVTGDATLRLVGFDTLIKALQAQPGEDSAGTAAGLTMFQVIGRQARTEDGKAARDYDIVVDSSGKMLLNGTDLAAMVPKSPQ